MKKNVIILLALTLPLFIMSTMPERSSSGAPASHTGAPGEVTCTTSGCHDDNQLNKGTATLTIKVGDGITNYVPGQTYKIKVKIADPSVNRFGFQLVALANQTNLMAGSFEILDAGKTQLLTNDKVLTDRSYVTYTFNGTDATSSGTAVWYVNWTAPSTNVGPVTFYAGGVSANDDMTDKGDYVYTTSVSILN